MPASDPAPKRASRLVGEALVFGVALLLFAGLDPVLKDWGLPLLLRWPAWAFIASLWLLPFASVSAAGHSSDYADARLTRPFVIATACAVSASGVLVLLRSTRPPLPLIGSIAGICALGAGVWLAVFAYA